MHTIDFILAVHNHQPVGNFDAVVEDAYQKAYRPFLDVLAAHPAVKVGIHNSGCLVDWMLEHRPEYLDRLEEMVGRGQVELLTGGYYEPIFSSIPEEDREGQIRKLSDWIRERFGREPTGLWLTERVWEPGLVGAFARAGVAYTMVDDTHFIAAGLGRDRLWGHYMTEDQGDAIRVFPISKKLRYLIPFADPGETISFLRGLAAEEPGRTAVLGDDGEKFGVWPETHDLVYTRGWLERFFTLLEENQDWLHLKFGSEVVAGRAPLGKVYLPTASYEEMMEWALPAETQARFHAFRARIESDGAADTQFVRGGYWRNFFARYPESDHINKRLLAVRKAALALEDEEARRRARDLLWAAECNCAYWHGVFGGLYLPHLRDALTRRILAAEAVTDRARRPEKEWTELERVDFDCDGDREIFLRNPDLTLILAPDEGGALHDIGVKPLGVALGNGLSRRPEAYHEKVHRAAPAGGGDDGDTRSIHDLVLSKEEGLERYLHYDRYRRASLQDHFLRSDTSLEDFHRGDYGEQGDFVTGAYEVAAAERDGTRILSLRRTGRVWSNGVAHPVSVEKRVRLAGRGAAFEVDYRVENRADREVTLRFGVEWNFAMMGGDSPDHFYRIPGVPRERSAFNSTGETEETAEVALVDRHRGFEARLTLAEPACLWRSPVETVSLSEGGFERIYQMSTVFPNWRHRLAPGEARSYGFRLEVIEL